MSPLDRLFRRPADRDGIAALTADDIAERLTGRDTRGHFTGRYRTPVPTPCLADNVPAGGSAQGVPVCTSPWVRSALAHTLPARARVFGRDGLVRADLRPEPMGDVLRRTLPPAWDAPYDRWDDER